MNRFTFVCVAYKDCEQLSYNIPSLIRVFPNERVVVITDGDDDSEYDRIAQTYNFELVRGERLYALRSGGRLSQRFLDVFLGQSGDYLVKFDTDTRFFRQFTQLPPGEASGCIWGAFGIRYLQGGCRIFSRSCAEQLDKAGLFRGDRYSDLSTWCPLTAEELYKTRDLISEDFIVRDALLEVGIPISDYSEIFSAGHVKRWRFMDVKTLSSIINQEHRYAVTHPWKIQDIKWAQSIGPILTSIRSEDP